MRKIQMLRDGFGVINVVEGTAAMLRGAVALQFGQTPLIPELHRESDDVAALLLKECCDCGGIDASGHGNGDETALRFHALGEGVKSCGGVHGDNFILTDLSWKRWKV
jgi:hypothetical protein